MTATAPTPSRDTPCLTFRNLSQAISLQRLTAYSRQSDSDSADAAARYLWNMALANAFQPVLHVIEVAFRNALFDAGVRATEPKGLKYRNVSCWLDAIPSLLAPREQDDVDAAVTELHRVKKGLTPGHLVSRLSFGFWVRLCQSPYEQGNAMGPQLWPSAARWRFATAPKPARNRTAIFYAANSIREFRNLVAHHQPIWDANLSKRHSEALEFLSWMGMGLSEAVARASQVDRVLAAGPGAYRSRAEKLIAISL